MTFVAPDPRKWSVDTVAQGLFNCCFSPMFRRQMHVSFSEFVQGKRTIQEYLCQLRSMAARLPDITKFQLLQRYWDGVNPYLRLKWTKNGYSPEFSELEELELAAERFENTENLWGYEARKNTREGMSNNNGPNNTTKGGIIFLHQREDIPQ
jgi:Retrotransposon gag protein